MRGRDALISGIGAGVVMTIATWLAEWVAPCSDMPMIWGTMMLPASREAWLLGLVVHLAVSALVGLVYALAFEHITHHAGLWTGVLFSLVHSTVAGAALGFLPRVHPRIPQAIPAPGWFATSHGVWGVCVLFVAHAAYGAFIGATYGAARRHPGGVLSTSPRRASA